MIPSDSGDWGEGACWFPMGQRIKFFHDPHGKIAGFLHRDTSTKIPSINLFNRRRQPIQKNKNDFVHIGNSSLELVKVQKDSAGFLKVFTYSMSRSVWIDKVELVAVQGKFFTYPEFLFSDNNTFPKEIVEQKSKAKLGINILKSCVALRIKPSLRGKKTACLPANGQNPDGIIHLKVLEHQGKWAFVQATQYVAVQGKGKSENCEMVAGEIFEGWIKILTGNQTPNIWFSVKK